MGYSAGTITLTNGSTAVTGSGTAFNTSGAVKPGFILILGSGKTYEIASVASDTSMTLSLPFEGTTGALAASAWKVIKISGGDAAVNTSLAALISNFSGIANGAGAGKFPDGSLGAPGIRFTADEDTGLARLVSNAISLIAGGAEQMRLAGGLATGAAVTASKVDTTLGKLLKVGDYGLGIDAGQPVANLDTWQAGGLFHGYGGAHAQASTGDNPYPTMNNLFALLCMNTELGTADEYRTQIAIPIPSPGAGERLMKIRTSGGGGTWNAWRNFLTQSDILGTVAMTSGVATGALFQTISNANGRAQRDASGAMRCSHTLQLGFNSAGEMRGTWTFPSAFVAAPEGVAVLIDETNTTMTPPYSDMLPITLRSIGTTSCQFSLRRRTGGTDFVSGDLAGVRLFASGRWVA